MEIINHPVLGELADTEPLTIYFEGQELKARPGQTVASALISSGVYKFGHSRKLVQPRGLFCANGRCCSCFMTVNGREHVRTCVTLVEEGMQIKKNMGDPDVRRDANAD